VSTITGDNQCAIHKACHAPGGKGGLRRGDS